MTVGNDRLRCIYVRMSYVPARMAVDFKNAFFTKYPHYVRQVTSDEAINVKEVFIVVKQLVNILYSV